MPFLALAQEIGQGPGLDPLETAEGGAALTGWATLPAIEKRRSRDRITSSGGRCGGHVTSVEVAHYTGGGPDMAYATTERLQPIVVQNIFTVRRWRRGGSEEFDLDSDHGMSSDMMPKNHSVAPWDASGEHIAGIAHDSITIVRRREILNITTL